MIKVCSPRSAKSGLNGNSAKIHEKDFRKREGVGGWAAWGNERDALGNTQGEVKKTWKTGKTAVPRLREVLKEKGNRFGTKQHGSNLEMGGNSRQKKGKESENQKKQTLR